MMYWEIYSKIYAAKVLVTAILYYLALLVYKEKWEFGQFRHSRFKDSLKWRTRFSVV